MFLTGRGFGVDSHTDTVNCLNIIYIYFILYLKRLSAGFQVTMYAKRAVDISTLGTKKHNRFCEVKPKTTF